jgi:hypothetical protein
VPPVFALGALTVALPVFAFVTPPVELLAGAVGALAPPAEAPPVAVVVVAGAAAGVVAALPPPYTAPPSPCSVAGGFVGLRLWGLALLA